MGQDISTKDSKHSDNAVVEKVEKKKKRYLLTFNQNRTKELFVGRETFVFPPNSSREVGEDVIKHPGFISQAEYFNVKEI